MTMPEPIVRDGAKAAIYRDAPAWGEARTAAIGDFSCASAESGRALLVAAKDKLGGEGFAAVIGPMDGDTWRRYRVVWESDGSPPYLMEPTSGPHDKRAFLDAGFATITEYVSARAPLAEAVGEPVPPPPGVTVAAWDGKDPLHPIEQMFDMSLEAFVRNRFYKPISREAFIELYRPAMPLIDPRLVLFAHDETGRLVGFVFGLPNRLEGPSPRTVIFKTYASRAHGVGQLLAYEFHRRALDMGFSEVIHALMYERNVSAMRSRQRQATVFRRYALLGARL